MRENRHRFQADDIFGPPGSVNLSRRDHCGDAAVQIAVNPAELILAWSPVAADGMHVAVDEAGSKRRAFGVDGDGGLRKCLGPSLSHGLIRSPMATTVRHQDGVAKVSAEQEADVADDEFILNCCLRFVVRHGCLPVTD